MAELERALATAAAAWGAGLDESVVFVGRLRAPLHVPPDGAGDFILNPHQEVFAFTPSTGLYRQLTAEDGHVVAVALAPDRRRIVYVTAEKLVRGAKPDAVALDGVALGELTLATHDSRPADPDGGRRAAARDRRDAARVRLPHRRRAHERTVRGRRRPDAGSPWRRQAVGRAAWRAARRADGGRGVAGRVGDGPGRLSGRRARSRNRPAADGRSSCPRTGSRRGRSAARSVRAWPDFRSRERGRNLTRMSKKLRLRTGRIMYDYVGKTTYPLDCSCGRPRFLAGGSFAGGLPGLRAGRPADLDRDAQDRGSGAGAR